MSYVYKHIRKDNGEIFYIGIGLSSDNNYKRAYDYKNRNSFWYKIIKKTDFIVEIICDNLSWEDACKKEIELIKFYGRRSNKTGTLCNLTEGGDGFKKNHLNESKIKICNFFKNKTYEELHGKNSEKEKNKRRDGVKKYWDSLSDEVRKKISESRKGKRGKQKNKESLILCPHCGKEGRASLIKRWHFDNCKIFKKK
jgi:hypothetical protein